MTQTICMEVAEEVLLGMNKSPEELARDIRLAAAVKWYEMGTISQERAAQVSGMSRAVFIDALARFGVSPFQETAKGTISKPEESGA
ncbi:MAG: UPF0175 family protein [Syntrophobacteraceae bacterium]